MNQLNERDKQIVNHNLRVLRQRKGVSQYKLGKALYCSRSLIAQCETQGAKVTPDLLARICDYFKVDPLQIRSERLAA